MTQLLTVTCSATVLVPDGWTIHPEYPERLLAPDGRQFKFWVQPEFFQNAEGEEVLENMDCFQMTEHHMALEHESSLLTLAPEPDPEDLDEAVHEEAQRRVLGKLNSAELPDQQEQVIAQAEAEASRVNNAGVEAQRAYLAGGSGEETAHQVYQRTGDPRLRTVM